MSEMSESICDLAGALAKAQGQFSNPERNREVEVRTKTGGSYKFRYATLDNILAMARKPLSENGLCVVQTVTGHKGELYLETTLMHASGQWIRTMLPISVEGGGNQALGGAITYAKRYAITAMLGIAADEDDDGNAADGNTIVAHKERQPRNAAAQQKPPANPLAQFVVTANSMEAWVTKFQKWVEKAPNLEVVDNLERANKETLQGLPEPAHNACAEAVERRIAFLSQAPADDQQQAA